MWVPADTDCYPKRWWDADTYLAACYGRAPGAAPLDDYGNLHHHYGRLWLLETDGSAGTPLTAFPAEPPFVGDYGYGDAWPVGDETLLQWSGDCGAAAIRLLQPDGTVEPLRVEAPGEMTGVEMVDVIDGVVAVYGWEGCDGYVGGAVHGRPNRPSGAGPLPRPRRSPRHPGRSRPGQGLPVARPRLAQEPAGLGTASDRLCRRTSQRAYTTVVTAIKAAAA